MRTPFYAREQKRGAKFTSFHGWDMPLQFESVLKEHASVRSNVGLFNVSHMAVLEVMGELSPLVTNHLPKNNGRVVYTLLPTDAGGILEDALIYKRGPSSYFMIVNCGNRLKVSQHLAAKQLQVRWRDDFGILALQGPKVKEFFPEAQTLKRFHFQEGVVHLAATGYTGEDGVEMFGPFEHLFPYYDQWVDQGVTLCGLGARDTLRLEMGYPLYGQDLTEAIAPLESVAAPFVKMEKNFLSKEKVEKRVQRKTVALCVEGPGIPRSGANVFQNNQRVGIITSGTFSPSLKKGIALALVDKGSDQWCIEIRGKQVPTVVEQIPFYKGQT